MICQDSEDLNQDETVANQPNLVNIMSRSTPLSDNDRSP